MVKLLSLFSGIGAFEKALQNLDIPFELVAYCEIDKYASKAYSVLHNVSESMNLGDITKVDETTLPTDIDLITYGFPCQPFSTAGRQEGFNDSKGRGNLFFDALRIIKHCKPKIAIAENVKNLTSDKSVELTKCMNDYLEEVVDEKYFVDTEKAKALIPKLRQKLISNAIRGGAWHNRPSSSMGFGGRFRQGFIVSKQGTEVEKLTDCACTIMARDFKGFGNQGMNAVVEYEIK